jgi:hypothetical protein
VSGSRQSRSPNSQKRLATVDDVIHSHQKKNTDRKRHAIIVERVDVNKDEVLLVMAATMRGGPPEAMA